MMRWVYHALVVSVLAAACVTGGGKKEHAGDHSPPELAATGADSDVPDPYKARKKGCEKYADLVVEIAGRHGLEPELVLGVIKVESNFNPECRSRVGATGLMQLMPGTAKHMKCGSDMTDPEENIDCGCRVLKRYIDRYGGNVLFGLAAYNSGPGYATPHFKEEILPFNFDYVEKVLRWRNVFVRFGCR
jgi:soluble lytic murein transglycosylase-like protein